MVIVFIEEIDATRILEALWTIQQGSLVLRRWHSGFDPLKERAIICHLWVLLPALPSPLWNKDILTGLENSIGHFVAL